jgi:uncharacterized protein YbcV (DUF1398 family)
MKQNSHAAIHATFEASNAGSIHFGEVIRQLASAEVESYQVDYRSGRATYFMPDGDTLDLGFARPEEAIADHFDGDAVRSAILGAQRGEVIYPEFKVLTQKAGCIGYTVWIAGRHVTYFGRKGETHMERFPS